MRAIEIPSGDSGLFCSLAEMMMQSLEGLLKSNECIAKRINTSCSNTGKKYVLCLFIISFSLPRDLPALCGRDTN